MSAGAKRPDDAVGAVAEEAARLIDAAAERARVHLTAVAGVGTGNGPAGGDCGWCPLCRAAAFVRDTDPELRERIVSSATTLVLALRDLAESAVGPPRGSGRADGPRTSARGADAEDVRP